ncbi:nuclear pore complex protein Nup155-like [Limulus polyphemus]|uniref:Nuclear pore complex protein Nup155-like n=1 Tax=Limulus polyphemus TaxID=6850 RepID=A0ABM1RW73_LIMPO|nr:nuclear pore complex protein Nup155-like [Limulus polyphemus]
MCLCIKAFLVKYLEFKTCNEDFSPKWLFSTLLEVGVDLPQLHETYHKLYRSKDLCWKTARKPLHLLNVIVALIAAFVESPSLVHLNERRAFTTKCLDAVAGYLVDLQSCNSADPAVQALSSEFKAVQLKLERLP